jgi:uncharacterized alkaline shock family protein YloU
MPERSVAGSAIVTRRAIVDIVRTAVQSSYGVIGLSDPSFGRRLLRWLRLDRPGVRLSTEDGLRLDVYITVAGGVPVAEVARQVDSAVRYSIRRNIGVDVAALRVHVGGVVSQPETVHAEPTEQPPAEPARSAENRPARTTRKARAVDPAKAAARGTATRRRKTE